MYKPLPIFCILLGLLTLAGCPSHNQGLDGATDSFARRDYPGTIQRTQSLIRQPGVNNEDLAATLYLQGRAYEELPAADESAKMQNLASARRSYVDALGRQPSKGLEGRIRAGAANVSYHQEDYNTALQQWTASLDQIDLPDQKPWILYRIGLSQQRLGRFDQADQTLARVQSEYPNTEPARRAKEKQGVRQFYVQVAVFSQPALASKTIDALKRMGHVPLQSTDAQGRTVISVGPAGNWAGARQLQMRVAPQYPDALIVP